MLLCKGGYFRAGSFVTVERYFRVGSMPLGGRGQGQKVTACVDVAGENCDCIRNRTEPPGGTRVHEQSLPPHSCGEGWLSRQRSPFSRKKSGGCR